MRSRSALGYKSDGLYVQGHHIRRAKRPHSASKSELTTTTTNLSVLNKEDDDVTDIAPSEDDVTIPSPDTLPRNKGKTRKVPFAAVMFPKNDFKPMFQYSDAFLREKINLKKKELKMEELILLDKMNMMELELLRKPRRHWYARKDTAFHYESAKNTQLLRNESDMQQKLVEKLKERKRIDEAQWIYAQLYDLDI